MLFKYLTECINLDKLSNNKSLEKACVSFGIADRLWDQLTIEEQTLVNIYPFLDINDYYDILKSWKDFHKNNLHKKYKKEYYGCANSKDYKNSYVKNSAGKWECKDPLKPFMMVSNLTDVHHLFYCIIKNKDLDKLFTRKSLHLLFEKLICINHLSYLLPHDYCNNGIKMTYREYIRMPFGEKLTDEYIDKIVNYYKEYCKMNKINNRWMVDHG